MRCVKTFVTSSFCVKRNVNVNTAVKFISHTALQSCVIHIQTTFENHCYTCSDTYRHFLYKEVKLYFVCCWLYCCKRLTAILKAIFFFIISTLTRLVGGISHIQLRILLLEYWNNDCYIIHTYLTVKSVYANTH